MTDLIFECIPMMVFMLCFFGYMDFMILYKWVHVDSPAGPPSAINSLICMAMGQPDQQPLWDGSLVLSGKLMLFTVCAVPVMLIPKPVILYLQNKSKEGH